MKSLRFLGIALVGLAVSPVCATTYYYEPFNYGAGANVTSLPNFVYNSGTTNSLQTASPSSTLNYTLPGYTAGSGNSLIISQALSEDAYSVFTSGTQQILASAGTTVSVYLSAQIKMTAVPSNATGTYFLALLPTDSPTNYQARVFARQDSVDTTKFNFGIQVGSAGVVFENTQRAINTTYLVVDRFDMVGGAVNDTARLYVNPASASVEPSTPDIICTTPATADVPGVNKVGYRQAANEGVMQLDEVRVGDTYADGLGFSAAGVQGWNKY